MFLEKLPEALGQLGVSPTPKGTQSFIFWDRGSLRVWGPLHKTKPPSQTAALAKGLGEPKSPPSFSVPGVSLRAQRARKSPASHLQPSLCFPASPPQNTLPAVQSLATQPSLAPHYPRTNVLIALRASLSFPAQLPTLRSHLLLLLGLPPGGPWGVQFCQEAPPGLAHSPLHRGPSAVPSPSQLCVQAGLQSSVTLEWNELKVASG